MACDIIIAVWNHLDETRACLESIFAKTRYPYRVIIIDNASERETREYLENTAREHREIALITNKENLGFIKAVNHGLRFSDADYVCVLNNDTLVTGGWLTRMIQVLEKCPEVALANPSSNNLGQRPSEGETIDGYAERLGREDSGYIELGAAVGFCMLMSRRTKERFGLFDEIYGMGNFEDTDYSRRVQQAGLKCGRAKAAYVFHKEGTSFKRGRKHDAAFRKNQEIFHGRWGWPKRVLYVISRDIGHQRIDEIRNSSAKLAGTGNWVWFFIREGVQFVPNEHSNISVFELPRTLFWFNVLFRVLKRKKKFGTIYVDSEAVSKIMAIFRVFHNAGVISLC